jgi:FAD:protein FMN transferase
MSDPSARSVSRREALRISAVAGVSLALGGVSLAALVRAGRLHRVQVTDTKMGTLVTLTVVHLERAAAHGMIAAAFGEMDRLEDILSRHRPTTPLARLNRHGVVRDAPRELVNVVDRALGYSSLTGGAFDVTVAPLLELVERRFADTGAPPADAELEGMLSRVGYRAVRIDGSSITFDRPGMAITLDGIAKGYIVDRTLARLVEAGAERVMVNGGGDVASSGTEAPGDPWRVGIQHPRDGQRFLGLLRLRGEGVATSGDYMQSFTEDLRHHHILDPRTGRSPGHTSSVTVVTSTAMEADALSTAAMVLGPDEGLALLEQREDVEALIVTKGGEARTTRGFTRYAGRGPADGTRH